VQHATYNGPCTAEIAPPQLATVHPAGPGQSLRERVWQAWQMPHCHSPNDGLTHNRSGALLTAGFEAFRHQLARFGARRHRTPPCGAVAPHLTATHVTPRQESRARAFAAIFAHFHPCPVACGTATPLALPQSRSPPACPAPPGATRAAAQMRLLGRPTSRGPFGEQRIGPIQSAAEEVRADCVLARKCASGGFCFSPAPNCCRRRE
jgi:hypothetical protein